MFWIVMIGLFVCFVICFVVVKNFVDMIKEIYYIKYYRKNDEWHINTPEYLKHIVIPNEEYGV